MKSTVLLLSACIFGALGAVMVSHEPSFDGTYIAVFHTHATEDERLEVIDRLTEKRKRSEEGELTHHSLHEFKAVSGQFSEESLKELLKEDKINYIQPNMQYTKSACMSDKRAPWHLERLNNVWMSMDFKYNGTYQYSSDTAANVDAYIMDSGIEVSHPEFEGRATWGVNTVDRIDRDCDGHGTHVAGTVGSKTYGVAKKVNLISVKVLNCAGSGSSRVIFQGHEWIAKQYQSRKKPAVVNMSLGSSLDRAHNDIVANAIKLGITYVTAAGNDFRDGCRDSPGSVRTVINVGATDKRDVFTDFSNWGPCVSILAPGQDITSTWPGRSTNTISGTSMAAPHVAGAAAIWLAKNPTATPADIKRMVQRSASAGSVERIPRATTGLLLQMGCNVKVSGA